MRECGLKHHSLRNHLGSNIVTPRAGVWIETSSFTCKMTAKSPSLPVRECGLKHYECDMHEHRTLSLPVRECGLKPDLSVSV